jgi:hypothetical protein
MKRVASGECLNLVHWLSHECTTIFVSIAPMVVGEVSLNGAIAFAQTNPIKNQVSAPFSNVKCRADIGPELMECQLLAQNGRRAAHVAVTHNGFRPM